MESAACVVVVPVVSAGRVVTSTLFFDGPRADGRLFFDGADGCASGRPGVRCGAHSAAVTVAFRARLRFSLLNMVSWRGFSKTVDDRERAAAGRCLFHPRAEIRKFTLCSRLMINSFASRQFSCKRILGDRRGTTKPNATRLRLKKDTLSREVSDLSGWSLLRVTDNRGRVSF